MTKIWLLTDTSDGCEYVLEAFAFRSHAEAALKDLVENNEAIKAELCDTGEPDYTPEILKGPRGDSVDYYVYRFGYHEYTIHHMPITVHVDL